MQTPIKKQIIVVDYDPNWAVIFEHLKSVFKTHLGNSLMDIQHVGSTSVSEFGRQTHY